MSFLDVAKSQATELFDQSRDWILTNPRLSSALGLAFAGLTGLKLLRRYRGSKTQFSPERQDLSKVAIIITGCGSGIGRNVALKLAEQGYCVIACNRREVSVSELNNNPAFTKSGSFSVQMDVTDVESIKTAKNAIKNWLNEDKDRMVWSIINNAGIIYNINFEAIPHDWMMREINVLLMGPINVTRAFLPLLYGRTEAGRSGREAGKFAGDGQSNIYSNGGRVVNVSSCMAWVPMANSTRYGSTKRALSYMTHVLRGELAGQFGIWAATIELGPFKTTVMDTSYEQLRGMKKYYEDKIASGTIGEDEKEIYDTYKIDKYVDAMIDGGKDVENMQSADLSPVVDSIIHATLSQYPRRVYAPGVPVPFKIIRKLPLWLVDKINWSVTDQTAAKLK